LWKLRFHTERLHRRYFRVPATRLEPLPRGKVALRFTQVFPIGAVIALLSAGILRKKVRNPANEVSKHADQKSDR
jgi:hypothetical protein